MNKAPTNAEIDSQILWAASRSLSTSQAMSTIALAIVRLARALEGRANGSPQP